MIKQVIVVRKDLNMRKGKLAAQVAHASVKSIMDHMDVTSDEENIHRDLALSHGNPFNLWLTGLQTKIVVGCDGEQEINNIAEKCQDLGISYSIITDVGKTEFNGVPTITCIAVGPDHEEWINEVTSSYKLL